MFKHVHYLDDECQKRFEDFCLYWGIEDKKKSLAWKRLLHIAYETMDFTGKGFIPAKDAKEKLWALCKKKGLSKGEIMALAIDEYYKNNF